MKKRGSLTDDKIRYYEPKTIRSAPVTPCDSESSTWSDRWSRKNHDHYNGSGYEKPYDSYIGNEGASGYDKASYEESVEGVWWWRRPLGVRRTQCRRCGASSSSRPLRMSPCAGMTQDEDNCERRPIMSRDRPLNFVRQLFL